MMQNDQQVATLKRLIFYFTLTDLRFSEEQIQHTGGFKNSWGFFVLAGLKIVETNLSN